MLPEGISKPLTELTRDEIRRMNHHELLQAIWSAEESYKPELPDRNRDHRRILRKDELETVLVLAQRLVRERADARPAVHT